jgi:hypothetical protein
MVTALALSDAALVDRLRRRDQGAFATFVGRSTPEYSVPAGEVSKSMGLRRNHLDTIAAAPP